MLHGTVPNCTVIFQGTVPNELSVVPDKPLRVSFGNIAVTPNDRLEQSQVLGIHGGRVHMYNTQPMFTGNY